MSWIAVLITFLLVPLALAILATWLAFKVVSLTIGLLFGLLRGAFRVVVR